MTNDPLIGRILDDRIRIDRRIGSGASGHVYAGTHLALKRPVAVKVIAFERALEQEAVLRFEREARAMSAIEHPHVVSIFDFGCDPKDGLLYLVMERVEGRTLAEELAAHGRIELARAARILSGTLEALEALHAHGIIHRDLKPANIMLVPAKGPDFAKLCDFGVAKILHSSELTLTKTGGIIGTPAYMAPEQASGGEIDPTTDLYALGVVLFEALTGRLPFQADTPLGTLAMHVRQQVPPSGSSREVDALLLRLLSKRPIDRFQRARDVRLELDRIASGRRSPKPGLLRSAVIAILAIAIVSSFGYAWVSATKLRRIQAIPVAPRLPPPPAVPAAPPEKPVADRTIEFGIEAGCEMYSTAGARAGVFVRQLMFSETREAGRLSECGSTCRKLLSAKKLDLVLACEREGHWLVNLHTGLIRPVTLDTAARVLTEEVSSLHGFTAE